MTDPDMSEIRQAFAIEGTELLAEMESSLLALEADPGSVDEFSRLFRAVHTIKGSASIVSFEAVEHFCHDIEHIFVRIRDNELALNQKLVALLLKCHDHISAMMDQFCVSNEGENYITLPPAHDLLLVQLQKWSEETSAGKPETREYDQLDKSFYDDESGAGLHFFDDVEDVSANDERQIAGSPSKRVGPDENKSLKKGVMRVDAERVDQLSDLVVELVTASSVLEAHVRRLGDLVSTESALHVSGLVKQIQEKTMSFRMVPVQTLFKRFHRIVHDATGKQIKLQIIGGETELDKTVAEKLHEPLLHLVRNAIDHGIEVVSERTARGKSAVGTIKLQAVHDSGNIVIRVGDDGQGICRENIARKAVERGLVKGGVIPAGTDVLSYIFEPGFSTLDDVTMLSGRGVGMDVVRKFIESIRGRIDVETEVGAGTTFQISIPLSLSLVDGFMLSLGNTLYIISMDLVQETMELPCAERLADMPNGCLQVRDKLLPCLDLRKVLGVSDQAPKIQHVVVFKHGGKAVGLVVDSLHGEIKTVVKPLGYLYRNVPCISGAGILGDGSIALFLETGKLVELSIGQTQHLS